MPVGRESVDLVTGGEIILVVIVVILFGWGAGAFVLELLDD